MDIGRGNFDIISPDQANPGISMMSRIIAQHLQNQATQSRTQGQDLMNQRNAATLPYAGPQAAANLQAQNLSNEWYAPEKRAQIAQANAYTQNTLAQAIAQRINNQYLPQKNQQDLAAQGLANKLAKALMPIQIQQAGANVAGTNLQNQGTSLHNQAAQATLPYAAPQAKAQVALTNAEAQNQLTGSSGGVDMGILNGLKNQLAQDHPDWDTNKVNDAAGQYLNGAISKNIPIVGVCVAIAMFRIPVSLEISKRLSDKNCITPSRLIVSFKTTFSLSEIGLYISKNFSSSRIPCNITC